MPRDPADRQDGGPGSSIHPALSALSFGTHSGLLDRGASGRPVAKGNLATGGTTPGARSVRPKGDHPLSVGLERRQRAYV